MKKTLIGLAVFVFGLSLSGCGQQNIKPVSGVTSNNVMKLKDGHKIDIKLSMPKEAKYLTVYYQGSVVSSKKIPANHIARYKDNIYSHYSITFFATKTAYLFMTPKKKIKSVDKLVIKPPKHIKKPVTQKKSSSDGISGMADILSVLEDTMSSKKSSYNTGITYDQLARTPDKVKSKLVTLTGEVAQVLEGESEDDLRVAINGDYDDIVMVAYDPSIMDSRVLENDKVTFYGQSFETISYKSTTGESVTVPLVVAKMITDYGEAPDDYGE